MISSSLFPNNNAKNRTAEAAELMGECETEYFGVSPYAILDQIGSIIVDAYSALSSEFSIKLTTACPFLSASQLEAISNAWLQLVENAVDRNFELFEMYCLRNVFKLPEGYVLPSIEGLLETMNLNVDEKEFEQLLSNFQNVNFYFIVLGSTGKYSIKLSGKAASIAGRINFQTGRKYGSAKGRLRLGSKHLLH
jgi:hypothetical protein